LAPLLLWHFGEVFDDELALCSLSNELMDCWNRERPAPPAPTVFRMR
jgi:hypothetical protein